MAEHTEIQWCDSTCNPIMGCDGCELWTKVKPGKPDARHTCYAGVLHELRGGTNRGFSPTFEQITYHPGRMATAARLPNLRGRRRADAPWLDGMPRLVFVSDMADALSNEVPFEFLRMEIIDVVLSKAGQRHIWLWLTKRPHRMAEFYAWLAEREVPWPANLWPGTSITMQATTTRIAQLLAVGDATTRRFLSVEPQWEPLNLRQWLPKLDWCIQGGESGPDAKPFDVAWADDLLAQCREASKPYFLKQLGSRVIQDEHRLHLEDGHGGDWLEWPEVLRVRQMPRHTSGVHGE